jgi:prepilin-type N-terminal cleavage/methylation domain-containing protein
MNSGSRVQRGVTLIEMVLTISIGSVVFGLAVTLLASILRGDRTARQHLAATQTIGRLAMQFRHDAHLAKDAELVSATDGATDGLRLASTDGSEVKYQWMDGSLERTESQTDKPSRRELFKLPNLHAVFEISRANPAETAVLSLESSTDESKSRSLRIEARIGRLPPSLGTPREGLGEDLPREDLSSRAGCQPAGEVNNPATVLDPSAGDSTQALTLTLSRSTGRGDQR